MSKTLVKKKTLIIFFSILLIGFFLRAYHLTSTPRLGATFDEFAWTWVGMNLIEKQVPSSWSSHKAYGDNKYYKEYKNAKFWIVEPWLEHPPLFGIIAGGFAYLNGASDMFDVDIGTIRPLALLLGIFSIATLFLLVREIYDEKLALLASLIYATVPTIVIGSRLVQNENFFIPFFLLSLLLIVKFLKTNNTRYRDIAAIICGLLMLSKVPWLAAPLAISAILIYKNKYKDMVKFISIVIPIFSLYIFYGLYYNSEIFINLWELQLARYDLTFNSVFALFSEPFLADRFMIDGWIYFGWLAFFLLLVKDFKKNYILIFGLLAYLGIFILAIPNEPGHGWYRYPFYPFLAISLALFVKEYFNKITILTFLFILLVGLSLLELSFKQQFGFSFFIFRAFIISTFIILLPLFFKSKKIDKYSKIYSSLMLIFLFGLNVWSVMEFQDL